MNVVILSIGDELLSGNTVNTNFSWIGRKLSEIGCSIIYQATIPDNKSSIVISLDRIVKMAPDVIITTGGLGPTSDDITRKTVFDYLSVSEEFDKNYWEQLKNKFHQMGVKIGASNRSQAMVPDRGHIINNPLGSARGFHIDHNGVAIIILPGVPFEMKNMINDYAIPFINQYGIKKNYTAVIRTTGISESKIFEMTEGAIIRNSNCTIGYYPSYKGVDIRIKSNDQKLTNDMQSDIINILDNKVFYSDCDKSMEQIVVDLAIEKNKKIAVAESCTGGLIGHRITQISGSSKIFLGGVIVYSNYLKEKILSVNRLTLEKHGAVSKETAEEMAKNILEKTGADLGLSVTGIAGPEGGSPDKPVGTVFVGLADKDNVFVTKINFINDREVNKLKTSQLALNELRMKISK